MSKKPLSVEALRHDATRKNIPTAEYESVMRADKKAPVRIDACRPRVKGEREAGARASTDAGQVDFMGC